MIWEFYPITPVPKPRMTYSDAWKKRPAVVRYWNYRDLVRATITPPSDPYGIIFFLEPARTRSNLVGKPHQQKPDLDNLLKGFWDAIFLGNDAIISVSMCAKFWWSRPGIGLIPRDDFCPYVFGELKVNNKDFPEKIIYQ